MVNAKSDTEGLQVAYELFGKKAGGAIYQACKNGSLSFEKPGTSLKDNVGNLDKTLKFSENLNKIIPDDEMIFDFSTISFLVIVCFFVGLFNKVIGGNL